MSQSRNRRPVSRAREPSRAAAPPADYVTRDAKENYGTKNTYKIPKSVRYDLENALVGLCDIWFEEIKPHLVKNKLKLHTGGALNEDLEPAREHRSGHEEPRRAPGRLLDPGAASDIRRPAASCRAYSPTRPVVSRAPCPRPPSPARPMPLSPNNFRKLLQLPDEKRTRQPARSTPAPPPLTQTYQRNAHKSTNQWMRPPVQETPLRQPSRPKTFTRTRTHQQKYQHTPEQRATDSSNQPPGRKPTRSPSPVPTSSNLIYQRNGHNVLKQDTSRQKTRKSKKIRKPQLPSLSQQPPRQVLRPCCTACALAANALTANIPQRPLAATRFPPPRTKNTLPSKPPPDNMNANSTLRRFDVKIPHISYPTLEPTASAIPLPPRVRLSPAGDVLQSFQITAGNSQFLHDTSGTHNVFVRNPTQHIHSVNIAPVPPKFGKSLPTPPRAINISLAAGESGDVQPFPHVAVGNYSSSNVDVGNYLPLQNPTGIRNPNVRKPSQSHSANTVPIPSKFERIWPSPLCGTKFSPGVGNLSSPRDDAGDSPHPSDFAGSRYPLDAARTAPMPPYFRRKTPCPLLGVGILPSPAHAKCMSPAQARSQSPVPSPVSPPPSEDEIWFHRVFKEDMTRQRGTLARIKEDSVQGHDICTSSSQTIPIHEESNFQNEDNHPLFSKDLIDLIGDKNDERLRVLYENPARDESHASVMHLVGSRNKRRKTAPKKMPWR